MEDYQTKNKFGSKEAFLFRALDRWNKLDQMDIDCESINSFKNKLEKIQKQKIYGFFMD